MNGNDLPNIVAVDLGAESCRVSLLEWRGGVPQIALVHRFANVPVARGNALEWELDRILAGLESGLARCAERCSRIAAIGVDGWAVDYVRLDARGQPLRAPRCYRDPRTAAIFEACEGNGINAALFGHTGVQPLRINTAYQLMADRSEGTAEDAPWVTLPEYVSGVWSGRFVAEFTNATHCGLVDAETRQWSAEAFALCGLSLEAAPELVTTGTALGPLRGPLAEMGTFRECQVVAPACHDTASAVAALAVEGDDWAYISSGTWSLVGTLLAQPITTPEVRQAGFTNLGAAGDRTCFHKNVNGMWLLKQTMLQLCPEPERWPVAELAAAAERAAVPEALLEVDAPELLLPGPMASVINAQRRQRGHAPIEESAAAMPLFASLIFHSLAARCAAVLQDVERLAGKRLRNVAMVGGGSLNQFLNRLTAEASGLTLYRGAAESSTIGNFAVQLTTLEGRPNERERLAHWAQLLTSACG